MIKHTFLRWKITVSCLDIIIGFIENKILFNSFFLEANKGLTHGLLLISFFDDFSLATPKKRTSHASAPISGNSTEISTKGNKYLLYKLQYFTRISTTEKCGIWTHVKIRYFYMWNYWYLIVWEHFNHLSCLLYFEQDTGHF